jgi:Protein of unknown function (DUF3631)
MFSASQIEEIATKLLGKPNRGLSTKHELRFGTHGSLSVDLEKGAFFDHEADEGGGIFDLIRREGHDPKEWLERHGFRSGTKPRSKPSGGNGVEGESHWCLVNTWSYTGENGAEVYQVRRFENGKIGKDGKPEKKYYQRRPDGNGGYVNNVHGVRQVPYRLPQLIEAVAAGQVIFIPGGEKCCDALVELGFPATCNSGGEGKWPDEITRYFKGADIVILPDNDEKGRKHEKLVAARLKSAAKRIRTLELSNLPPKGDVVDWIAAGGTREQLRQLAERSPVYSGDTGSKVLTDADFEAEIRRLAALSLLSYERERESAASALGIAATRLDRLVTANRKGDEPQAQGRPLEFPEPEPWPERVSGDAILSELTAAIKKHVVLSEPQAHIAALWILHAYVFDAFQCTPRLAITSPEKRCGKTTLMDVLKELVPRAKSTESVTPPAIFRTTELHRPTWLIDEADTFLRDNDELRGVINSGHRKGGNVTRLVDVGGGKFEPRDFSTHAPCAIALIGTLPDTLADRSIHIELRRRLPSESITQFRAGHTVDLTNLASKAARWTVDNRAALERLDPAVPDHLFNRQADNWRPLFAVAQAAGGEWPERAKRASLAGHVEPEESARTQLLADIQVVFAEKNCDRLTSEDLVNALVSMADRQWGECNHGKALTQNQLARRLKPFGIAPKTLRIGTGTAKGYLRESFEDAFNRYLSPKYPRSNRNTVISESNQ